MKRTTRHSYKLNILAAGIITRFQRRRFLEAFPTTVKPVLSGHSKRRPKLGFQDRLSLNAGQKYCRMLRKSILQCFRTSLSSFWSLRPLFCLFLSGSLRPSLSSYWSLRPLFCLFFSGSLRQFYCISHGNQSSKTISPCTMCSMSPYQMMLYI